MADKDHTEQGELNNNDSPVIRKEWRRFFTYRWIVKNIPFFLFLCLLAVFYIYNGHLADKLIRKIDKSEKNIKELEYQYKSIRSEVIYRSKASELVKAVEPMGLKESVKPPLVLGLKKEDPASQQTAD